MPTPRIVAAILIALSFAAIQEIHALSVSDPTGRNLFKEYLGQNRSSIDAKIETAWNQLFYGDDSNQRVYYPVGGDMAYVLDTGHGDVRSEGMSYGMMIAVQLDHKAEFDRLWKWAKTYMYHADGSRKGFYSWQCKPDGTAIDQGSASDGEEWFATALFFASGRWGDGDGIFNYSTEANAILDTMQGKGEEGSGAEKTVNMFDPETKEVRFVPLAKWARVTDPSYQLPAFYELWALWAGSNNDFWAQAARSSRELFRKAAHPETGLMPDLSDFDGKPYKWNRREIFSFDAHRAIANVAMDFAWFGKDPWQAGQSERVLKFLSAFTPSIPCEFSLDGKPLTKDTSVSVLAMTAVGALAADRETGQIFVQDLWDVPVPTGKYRYYNGLLYMMGMLQCAGRFNIYAPEGKPYPFESDASVRFLKFEYSGHDHCFENNINTSEYRNPILPGFHPDPSICKVGDEYYLVNASFAYFPGIPIYRSRDLVRWTQIGNVIDRADAVDLARSETLQGISSASIDWHDGIFYVTATLSDKGGNFLVTAKNPEGPWSDPVWLAGIEGVSPSLFFDGSTGKAYIVNSGFSSDDKSAGDVRGAIWVQEFDVASQKPIGTRRIIFSGGANTGDNTVCIDAPHIFKRGDWYYLICAEGTAGNTYFEVVFRSKSIAGPWVSWMDNPILTQRDISPDRPMPVTATGHAQFVDTGLAGWWTVFQGSRPYMGDNCATGRETFLLPVSWTGDGWPVILPHGNHVPFVAKAPDLDDTVGVNEVAVPAGNFTWSDDFSGGAPSPFWMMLGNIREKWLETGDGKSDGVKFKPLRIGLDSYRQPAYLAYRIQHSRFTAALTLVPADDDGVDSGLAVYMSESSNMFMGVCRDGAFLDIFLEQTAGSAPNIISHERTDLPEPGPALKVKVEIDGDCCTFSYSLGKDKWIVLATVESSPTPTRRADGFAGATVGPFARMH